MARRLMGDLRSKRLSSVSKELGVPLVNAHRAVDDAEACGRVFTAMASKFSAPESGREGRERSKSGRAPTDVVVILKWAHGTYRLPENEYLGYVQSGVPEFLDGPHEGELIESYQDYLQWMTIAQKRVDGKWMHRYSPPLRDWVR